MRQTPHNPYPPRPRASIGLLLAGAAVLALPIAISLTWLWLQWAALDLALPWLAMLLRVALFGTLAAAPALGLWAAWRRWGWRESIFADKQIALMRAQRAAPNLTSLSYSYHDSHKAAAVPELVSGGEPPALPPPSVPTFAQLLDQGLIGPGRKLILGIDAATGQPIAGDWKDLYSAGVGAQQGAGKTWLLAFLLAQSAAQGGRLIICDLHAGDTESLANRVAALAPAFMCDVADTPKAIVSALELANSKLEARKGNAARWPIVVCADEFTSLLRTPAGAVLGPLIQNIAEQGRKFNVNGLLAAQAWTKAAVSDVRNQLTAHYVLRQHPSEARYQLGLRAANLPDDVRGLPDATAYFLNVKGEMSKVVIPRMTAQDIARCGEMIERPAAAVGAAFGFNRPTLPIAPTVALVDANRTQTGSKVENASKAIPSPEAARAAVLFLAGKSPVDIALELRGVDITKGGRAAKPVREEIEQLIREGLSHA